MAAGTDLSGGSVYGGSSSADVAGNTLQVNAKGISVQKVRNFENYNFRLNGTFADGDTMLSLTEAGGFGGATVDWDKVTVDTSKLSNVQGEHTITLMRSNAADLKFSGATVRNRTVGDYETRLRTDGGTAVTRAVLLDVSRYQNGTVMYDGTKAKAEAFGGISRNGNTVKANTLTLKGTQTGGLSAAYGGKNESAAGGSTGNTVTVDMEGTSSVASVYGGYVKETANGGDVTGNKVILKKGTVSGTIYGGYTAGAGKASKNEINVEADVQGSIIGGESLGEASENILTIGAVQVGGSIIGGKGATTAGNTINLFGTKVAGMVTGGSAGKEGNILAIHASGTKVHDFTNIQRLRFHLPDNVSAAMPAMLTLGVQNKDIRGMNVDLYIPGSANALSPNDTIHLMKVADGGTLTTDDKILGEITAKQGASLNYKFHVEKKDTDKLVASVIQKKLNEATKSVTETRVAAMDFVNSGTNLMADAGITAALAAGMQQGNDNYTTWAAQGGTNMRVHSGSHVDTRGYVMNVGFVRKNDSVIFGPFVAYGRGTYDSYLDDGTHGNGKTSYIGAGIFGRMAMQNDVYIEGSLQGGRIKSDYTGNISGTVTGYDSSNPYYAGHIGVGKRVKLMMGTSIEGYLKYFYAHQNGMRTRLSTGEEYDFAAMDSHRLRLGARYMRSVDGVGEVYAGLAWEYEFSGAAWASYQGYNTPSPSLKGGSALVEFGYRFAPKKSCVSWDINAGGWKGKRQGLTGSIGINWAF